MRQGWQREELEVCSVHQGWQREDLDICSVHQAWQHVKYWRS